MAETAQWIVDARRAKKRVQRRDAIVLSSDPVKRRREIKAQKRSVAATPHKRKHGKHV